MTPLTIGIAGLVLGLLVGGIAVWGAPIFGLPILLLALGAFGYAHLRRRAERAQDMRALREEAAVESVEFTDRDRQTLA